MKTHQTLNAAEYDAARRGHLRQRQHAMIEEVIAERGPKRVLEIGCGTGHLLAELAQRFPQTEFTGLDESKEMIAFARLSQRANLRYEVGTIEPTLSPAYDFACSIDVLHHLQDPPKTFLALHSALVPGSSWVAIEPNCWHPYVALQVEIMRLRGLDEDHFRPWLMEPMFTAAGFACSEKRYAIVVPASVERLPTWLARAERVIERAPMLAGSVVYRLSAAKAYRGPKGA